MIDPEVKVRSHTLRSWIELGILSRSIDSFGNRDLWTGAQCQHNNGAFLDPLSQFDRLLEKNADDPKPFWTDPCDVAQGKTGKNRVG